MLFVSLAFLSLAALLTGCGQTPAENGAEAPSGATPTASGPSMPGPTDGGPTGSPRTVPARPSPPGAETREVQLRGVWVHLFDDTLKTRASLDRMLDEVAANGFNTVIVEVVRRQDAYYASRVLPRTTDPVLASGFDVLEATVAGAHERGLDVHAWFPAMPAHHPEYADLPAPPGWVWTDHGPGAPVEQRWVTRTADGEWLDYLDPGVPAVQDHVVAIAAELASNYDVDAVHVDYLRYPEPGAGYHPIALERFRQETGRADVPPPDDPQWSDWRRAQTAGIMRRIHAAVAAASPGTNVSAALIAWGPGPGETGSFTSTRAYREVFQNWPEWITEGSVDIAVPMTYFDASKNTDWYRSWVEFLPTLPAEATVAAGIGAWLNAPTATVGQVRFALDTSDGAVVYSYQQTSADEPRGVLLEQLGDGLFASPATPPLSR